MTQFARPVGDDDAGSWTTTPLWSKIDDDAAGAGDGVFAISELVANNTNTSFYDAELTNTGGTDPLSNVDHVIRVRWFHQTSGRSMQAHIELWQGIPDVGSQIAEIISATDVGTTEVEANYTLSTGEADNITDYDDLYFRFWGRGTGGGPSRQLHIEAAQFEFPDGGAPPLTETVTDDADVTDATLRVAPAVRTSTDDADVTDNTSRVAPAVRSQTEPVAVTDATPHALTIIRSITDPVGATDDATPALTLAVEIVEPVGATDQTVRVAPAVRVVTESVGVIDAATQAEENVEASVETVAVTDQTLHVWDAVRSATDDVNVTDTTTGIKAITVVVTDPVGVTDLAIDDLQAEGTDYFETATDPVGVTDLRQPVTTVAEVKLKTSADPVSSFHEITVRHQGDSQGGDATIKLMQGSTQIARFGMTVVQGVWNETSYELSVAEADSISDYADLRIRIQENPLSSVGWLRVSWIGMVLSEGDTLRTVTEPVGITDTVLLVKTVFRQVTDDVDVTDSTLSAVSAVRIVTDPTDVTDSVSSSKTIQVAISEPVGVSDVATPVHTQIRPVTDPVGVTDDTSRVWAIKRTVTEPVGVTDLATPAETGEGLETVTEAVGVTDATLRVTETERVVTEAVNVTDNVAAAKTIFVTITDPVGVTDQTAAVKATTVTIVEAVGVTDFTTRIVGYVRTLNEPVAVTDATSTASIVIRTVNEPVAVTDTTTIVILGSDFWQTDATAYTANPVGVSSAPVSNDPDGVDATDDPVEHTRLIPTGPTWS